MFKQGLLIAAAIATLATLAPAADFNGDGKDDLAVWEPSIGMWYVRKTGGGNFPVHTLPYPHVPQWGGAAGQWGLHFDTPLSGDFDGDGKDDLAIYRPTERRFYLRCSTGMQWLSLPHADVDPSRDLEFFARDFDRDGRDDLGILEKWGGTSGTFHVRFSRDARILSVNVTARYGVPQVAVGDYDGDGTPELAVYSCSTGYYEGWKIFLPGSSVPRSYVRVRNPSESLGIPVPGDYDGDGRTDLATYVTRGGLGYFRLSDRSYPNGIREVQWGLSIDIPIGGQDLDGDGVHDLLVWRPLSGRFYVRTSSGNSPLGGVAHYGGYEIVWGIAGMVPIRRETALR